MTPAAHFLRCRAAGDDQGRIREANRQLGDVERRFRRSAWEAREALTTVLVASRASLGGRAPCAGLLASRRERKRWRCFAWCSVKPASTEPTPCPSRFP